MRIISFLVIFLLFDLFFSISFADEMLFDAPIDVLPKKESVVEEFCEKYINDINIEEFIKKEIENDYVVVSLDECIDVALKNNFDIAIKEKEYFSSKYQYHNALSKFLPILTTRSYISDFRGQILVGGVLSDKFHETAISANLTAEHELTQGGKQIFEAKAKKYFSRSKKHNLNFTKSQILYYASKY